MQLQHSCIYDYGGYDCLNVGCSGATIYDKTKNGHLHFFTQPLCKSFFKCQLR
jgi:hypothetical protein